MKPIVAKDWSIIKDSHKIPTDLIFSKEQYENLGITSKDGVWRTTGLIGITRLKTASQLASEEQILIVKPRFEHLTPIKMLEEISEDPEFDLYEMKLSSFYHFFFNEKPIKLDDPTISYEIGSLNALLFLNLLKNITKKPLYGRMEKVEENMVSKIKGKIVVHKHIKQNVLKARPDRMYCAYQQFTYNVPENQFLKKVLLKVKRYVEDQKSTLPVLTQLISQCWHAMSHITLPNKNITRNQIPQLKGLYSYYNEVLDVAKIIDEEISIDFNGETSDTGIVIPYAINMQNLFELYSRHKLKQAIKEMNKSYYLKPFEYTVNVLDVNNINVVDDKKMNLYIDGDIKPDIIIYKFVKDESDKTVEKVVAVIDAKYKDFNNDTTIYFVRNDRLQILAYGYIFQPEHIGHIFPDSVTSHIGKQLVTNNPNIHYHMLGLSGKDEDINGILNFL